MPKKPQLLSHWTSSKFDLYQKHRRIKITQHNHWITLGHPLPSPPHSASRAADAIAQINTFIRIKTNRGRSSNTGIKIANFNIKCVCVCVCTRASHLKHWKACPIYRETSWTYCITSHRQQGTLFLVWLYCNFLAFCESASSQQQITNGKTRESLPHTHIKT